MQRLEHGVGLVAESLRVGGQLGRRVPARHERGIGGCKASHFLPELPPDLRRLGLLRPRQRRVKHAVFGRQVQLDRCTHGDQQAHDSLGLRLDTPLHQLAQVPYGRKQVGVIAMEPVNVQNSFPGSLDGSFSAKASAA